MLQVPLAVDRCSWRVGRSNTCVSLCFCVFVQDDCLFILFVLFGQHTYSGQALKPRYSIPKLGAHVFLSPASVLVMLRAL